MKNAPNKQAFSMPDSRLRAKPFWCWNGELKRDELLRQIDVLKVMGMGGYFCHSRVGLETEYLGEEWFEHINACADYGEAQGMESWLYDEDRWPSGTAGGMVTANRDFRARYIRLRMFKKLPAVQEGLLALFAARVDGVTFSDERRLAENDQPQAGETVLAFYEEEMKTSGFYNGNTNVDVMNPDAIADFISRTHEKYLEHCGDRLGTSLRGIFTDEAHRGLVMFGKQNLFTDDDAGDSEAFLVPYTHRLFERFEEKFGYRLQDNLPALFLKKEGEAFSRIKWHYIDLAQQLFIEAFAKPLNQWCREHGVAFTGHYLHEDNLAAQTAPCGSIMRMYEHMECPGVDLLKEHNYNYHLAKQLQSAAHQCGQTRLLTELYGCTGWQMRFFDYKTVGDWQALYGINFRCPHLSYMSMKGEAKRDFPASISFQSSWYDRYAYVEDYFARIHTFLDNTDRQCDLLVLNPIESMWGLVHPGWIDNWEPATPETKAINDHFAETFRRLQQNRIDFDYGDEEMLSRLGSVDRAADGSPILRFGQTSYRKVLVTGMLTMRRTTRDLLEAFAKMGGQVVVAGDAPDHLDAVKQTAPLLPFATAIADTKEALRDTFCDAQTVRVVDADGNAIDSIYVQVHATDKDIRVMLLNVDRLNAFSDVIVHLPWSGVAERWDPRTGEIFAVAASAQEPLVIKGSFAAGEEWLIAIAPEDRGCAPLPKRKPLSVQLPDTAAMPYKLSEPNLCVLNHARWCKSDGVWREAEDVLNIDRLLRIEMGLYLRGGDMYQPWFLKKYPVPTAAQPTEKVTLQFSFNSDITDNPLHLVVETPERYTITVNGMAIIEQDGWWVDPAFIKMQIPASALQKGENIVEMTTEFGQDSDLETIYLLGDFGVQLNGLQKTLTPLPETLTVGDVAKQGFPFYGGKITYSIPAPVFKEGEHVMLTIPSPDASYLCVHNQNGEKMIAFAPFEADVTDLIADGTPLQLEYGLTRRNTFGPYHCDPPLLEQYAPWDFVPPVGIPYSTYTTLSVGMTDTPQFICCSD